VVVVKYNMKKEEVKCPHCKYEWETTSKLDNTTCPNCQLKFNREKASSDEYEWVDKSSLNK